MDGKKVQIFWCIAQRQFLEVSILWIYIKECHRIPSNGDLTVEPQGDFSRSRLTFLIEEMWQEF